MEEAQGIESAMEEAIDQDETIAWPQEDDGAIAKRMKVWPRIWPLPISSDPQRRSFHGSPRSERAEPPFSLLEKTQLELAAQLLASRLRDLKREINGLSSAWNRLKESAAHWIGPNELAETAGLGPLAVCWPLVFIKALSSGGRFHPAE